MMMMVMMVLIYFLISTNRDVRIKNGLGIDF